jgi:hypothetical protein
MSHVARLLAASTAALAAFSDSSITVYPTSDPLACNAPALRHEHMAALPLYGTACEAASALRHDHAATLAAPSELSLLEDCPLYPDTLARNAPASPNEHTAALPPYGTACEAPALRRARQDEQL